ncbi:MAG: DEAD/DEAH box helicase family protein [Candidatus Magasanikbacteria bacterium]
MALHEEFPKSPHEIIKPEHRWFPAEETLEEEGRAKLLPPLVAELRKEVKEWRDSGYDGASDTSKALLNFWFNTEHPQEQADGTVNYFEYYFAQQEAVETIIWLHEIAEVRDPYDLMQFDASGLVSKDHFDEVWTRFVVKMATGSGKTKVLSLVLAWCFFHKTYEEDSDLARNFLLIAPNVIVFERLRDDFDGLDVFYEDPVIPENGYMGQNWENDFQLDVHLQDDVTAHEPTGNIFLTNIHRIYSSRGEDEPSGPEDGKDYFLGKKPPADLQSDEVTVGEIVRDLDELVVLNDEAHHIHEADLAWFQAIEDIHNNLVQKGSELSLQIDVTATPKDSNGNIFVQTICDYPLVEAIHQDVVKRPVVPTPSDRGMLEEHESSKFTERYRDFINLGYREWEKAYPIHKKLGQKAILFVMTSDTKNCDEVAEYLAQLPNLSEEEILVIHTNKDGSYSQAKSKRDYLNQLREESSRIDSWDSPYKAIVSVLMLREGWDVQNVTTIIGLRPFSAESQILPEQALGRGLRRMYRGEEESGDEKLSVVGTPAFMEFVEGIKREGVDLEEAAMNSTSDPVAPTLIEVDRDNEKKDIDKLDIEIPILSQRLYREYKNLEELDPSSFDNEKFSVKEFSEEEKKEITFWDIEREEESHKTKLENVRPDWRSVIGYLTNKIQKDMRLVSGHNVLYPKVQEFIEKYLFEEEVNLSDPNVVRNLSEIEIQRTIYTEFRKAINELTIQDSGSAEVQSHISIKETSPFTTKDKEAVYSDKTVFNKIVGDSHFELEFAAWLDEQDDVISFAKNYFAVNFKIEYQKEDGNLSYFYPDFFVKVDEDEVWVVETKGREDLDDVRKIERLEKWCKDVNEVQDETEFKYLYLKEDEWNEWQSKAESFLSLANGLK